MGNPRESKFWCTETMRDRSLWYWYVGPGKCDAPRSLLESGCEGGR